MKEFFAAEKELVRVLSADPMGTKHYDPVHDHSLHGDVRFRMQQDVRRATSEYLTWSAQPNYRTTLPEHPKWFRKSLIMAIQPSFLNTQQLARAVLLIDNLAGSGAQKGDLNELLDLLPGGKDFQSATGDHAEATMRLRLLYIPTALTMVLPASEIRKLDGNGSSYNRRKLAEAVGAFGYAETTDANGWMKSTTYYFKDYDAYVGGIDKFVEMDAEACSELTPLVE